MRRPAPTEAADFGQCWRAIQSLPAGIPTLQSKPRVTCLTFPGCIIAGMSGSPATSTLSRAGWLNGCWAGRRSPAACSTQHVGPAPSSRSAVTTASTPKAATLRTAGSGTVHDLFSIAEPLDNVVSNPPFSVAEAMIRHLLPLIRPGGKMALVLRTAFLEGACRDALYATMPPRRIWVSKSRASMLPGVMGAARDQHGAIIQPPGRGSTICFAWFVFEPGYRGPMAIDRL